MEMAVPARPNSSAVCCIVTSGKTEEAFRSAIFDGLWHQQKDIAEPAILKDALNCAGGDPRILDQAGDPSIHEALTKRTVEAYANGVFGTPTFVWDGGIYFGANRLEVLAWRMGRPSIGP